MIEWIYEAGIGEARAALIADGIIVEALIDWGDTAWGVGAVTSARIASIDRARGQASVTLPDGTAAILEPLPPSATSEGAPCMVEIIREPIDEKTRRKWPKVRLADADAVPRGYTPLLERLGPDAPVRHLHAHEPDLLEQAGWSELIEEAVSGEVHFPGGALLLSLTPAMALIDVDGTLPRSELALAGATAAARTIRRFGLGGSIGIDLPTLPDKAARNAAATAIDASLPLPFERTAVNGFGFVQIVRPRRRRSLPELIASDPDGAAARALLRQAERVRGSGALRISACPPVMAKLTGAPDWLEELGRRTGRELVLRSDTAMPRWGGHADAQHP